MTVAIRIENVSKLYRLGTVGTGTISHDINRWWHLIRGKEDPYAKIGQVNDRTKKLGASEAPEAGAKSSRKALVKRLGLVAGPEYVWALKDINLEVNQGEILGIIGRNGAGKSTLLKILSRVTAPTQGTIKTRGRIASLLEVGTGFHPELTGRENIYVNGAILGMRRHEITSQLDEIVEFSGCAKYLDTPVKRYSSGMTVRLGFAVAAHLSSEILIVDEVLAVGDVEFQTRCLGMMKSVQNAGRTVLFVSHNMGAIANVCTKVALLENGEVYNIGDTQKTTDLYLNKSETKTPTREVSFKDVNDPLPSGPTFIRASVCDESGDPSAAFRTGDTIAFKATLAMPDECQSNAIVAFALHDSRETLIANLLSCDAKTRVNLEGLELDLVVAWKSSPLKDGRYYLSVWVGPELGSEPYDYRVKCLSFQIDNTGHRKIRSAALIHAEADWIVTSVINSSQFDAGCTNQN